MTVTDPQMNDGTDPQNPPTLDFLHLWTGLDGVSRLDPSVMRGFGLQSVGGGAAPQWMRPFPGELAGIFFSALPVGWVGDWHESPHPQWVVPLRGRWFIEAQNGDRVEMGPGELHFGQDQGTTARAGGHGHRSGTVGDEVCVLLMLQFATSPAAPTRDPFG